MLVKEVTAVSLLIMLAVAIALVVLGWWVEEKYDETKRVVNRMARRDRKSARKRGDIYKGGRYCHGAHKVF